MDVEIRTRGGDCIVVKNVLWLPPVACQEDERGRCEICDREPPAWGTCRLNPRGAPPEQGRLDL